MRRLLTAIAIPLLMLSAGAAYSETCTSSGAGTWSGTGGQTGTATFTGCTRTADDNFVIGHDIQTPLELGSSGTPISGTITVSSGGSWDISPGVIVYNTGGMIFESGSCAGDSCTIVGTELTEIGAPFAITHSGTTIVLDYSEIEDAAAFVGGLPFTLSASGCDATTVHPPSSGNCAGSYVYVGWEKFGSSDWNALSKNSDNSYVDALGMFLEVTAVNATTDTITLTLPTLGPKAQTDGYTVAEALSTNTISNFVGTTTWTVASVTEAQNNEGKLRYETLINSGDTPFNADQEFEGYLACSAGTDSCLRMTRTFTNYSSTSEMFVTWGDPQKVWGAGDELDIYYAKINPGDSLTFFNPVMFDSTGASESTMTGAVDNMFEIAYGSELYTMTGVVFDDPFAQWQGTVIKGCVVLQHLQTTDVKTYDLILVEGCGRKDRVAGDGAADTGSVGAAVTFWDASQNPAAPDGDGVTNMTFSRFSARWPESHVDFATNPTEDVFLSHGMTFVDAQNERIGDYNAWNNGTLSEWSGNAWRKLRFEGYSTGLTNASSGVLVNCPDDLSVQNFVALHGRTSKPKDSAHDGEDTFEHFPETPSCGVDRVLIGAPNVGSAFGPLRHAQRGATTLTSIVVFGGSAAQGNSRDAAGRGLVSYAFPIAAPQPPSVSGQSHATAILNHNKGFASEGMIVSNFMTDGAIQGLNRSYGARVGWYRQTLSVLGGVFCGTWQVGMWQVGGGVGGSRIAPYACPESFPEVLSYDNYFGNYSRSMNNSVLRSCNASGNSPGSGIFQCDGGGDQIPMLKTDSASNSNQPFYRMDGNLFVSKTNAGSVALFDFDAGNMRGLSVTNTSVVQNQSSVGYVVRFSDGTIPTDFTIGPNVWIDTGDEINAGCRLDRSPGVFRPDCDFTASSLGDYGDVDGSPNGTRSLYITGDLSTGKNIRIVGSDGGSADATLAQPRWAGPIVWDWPFAWATAEKVGFHRTTPRPEFIPARLKRRMDGQGGGSSATFAPRAFGN